MSCPESLLKKYCGSILTSRHQLCRGYVYMRHCGARRRTRYVLEFPHLLILPGQLLCGATSRGWSLDGRRAASHVLGNSSGGAIMHCNGRHRSEVRRFVCGNLSSIDSLCYDVNNRLRANVDPLGWIVWLMKLFSFFGSLIQLCEVPD